MISSIKKASLNSVIRTSKLVSQNLSLTMFMSAVTDGGTVIYLVILESHISIITAVAFVFSKSDEN